MRKLMKFKTNDSGAIEGLPLQLLIMVIIAGVGIGIVVGWMSFSKTDIGSISADPNEISLAQSYKNTDGSYNKALNITISVKDQNGKPLANAIVKLEGCNVSKADKTDNNGQSTFSVEVVLQSGQSYGEIKATAEYDSTWGKTTKTTTILVKPSS